MLRHIFTALTVFALSEVEPVLAQGHTDPATSPVIGLPFPRMPFQEFDVAYDATHAVYLLAWRYGDDVLAQRVLPDGSLHGGPIVIDADAGYGYVRVANIDQRDVFVVAYGVGLLSPRTEDILARTVDPQSGVVSPPVVVEGGPEQSWLQDATGDSSSIGDSVIVSFETKDAAPLPTVSNLEVTTIAAAR